MPGWTVESLHDVQGHLVGGERDELSELPEGAWKILDERAAMHIAKHRPAGPVAKG